MDARRPTSRPALLAARSELLRRLRAFFYERGFIEVETPLLASEIIPEAHIEPFRVSTAATSPTAWLQASPELHMKRLLADGAQAIFQVTRSFRRGETGKLHSPEFTIVEWYRTEDDLARGMELVDALCQAMLDAPPARQIRYADAFQDYLNICPHTCSAAELATAARSAGVEPTVGMDAGNADAWLNLLLALRIEPHLGQTEPALLYAYPASQAALARIRPTDAGFAVAERFELYYRGVELANGYHELNDAHLLRQRLGDANRARLAAGRDALPLPESLLVATERGIPDATGVALGFDRLAMLALGADSIHDVRPA